MIWITMLEIIGAAQEVRESPHSATEEREWAETQPDTGGTQDDQRPWWRRWLGG